MLHHFFMQYFPLAVDTCFLCSPGGLAHLLTYETRRQQSVVPMITAIDFLKRLYSTSSPLPVLARTVGLIATNTLVPLKVLYHVIMHN